MLGRNISNSADAWFSIYLSPHDPTRISNDDRLVFSIPRKGRTNPPGMELPW